MLSARDGVCTADESHRCGPKDQESVTRPDEITPSARSAAPDVLMVALFCSAILAPVVSWGVRGVPAFRKLPEERMSAPWPTRPGALADLSTYPARFQAWFDDSLGLREALLRLRGRFHGLVLGVSPTPNAILGRDSWLFLSGAPEHDGFRGAAPLGRLELAQWAGAIDARRRWCHARGIEYVFMLAPTKESMYPERHPFGADSIGPTPFEQLARRLEGDEAFVDLRPAILRAKADDRENDHAYFPFGSHWTNRGAKAAASELFERLRARPKLAAWTPIASDEVNWDPAGTAGDSWAGRLYLENVLRQNELAIGSLRGDEPREVTRPAPRSGCA